MSGYDDSLIDEQNRAALESHDLNAEQGWPPDDRPSDDWPEDEGGIDPYRRTSVGNLWPADPEPDGSRYVPGVGWIATSR